jgi:tetratricopeptide (TPR) repeat protein
MIFGVVLWTFYPAVHNDFVGYDDPEYVTANPNVQQGLHAQSVGWAFSATAAANWHPLTWLSHMLDCQVFGLRPSGHHFTSILIHAFNAALLFLLLNRITGNVGRSLVVGLFFGLHPLRVESVAWVAERKDVLSALFFLLTLFAYVEHAIRKSEIRNPKSETSSKSQGQNNPSQSAFHVSRSIFRAGGWYILALVSFSLGLMSKPMLVTLPFVMLLLDFWPLGRLSGQGGDSAGQQRHRPILHLLLEKLPFFLLAVSASIVTYFVQSRAGAVLSRLPLVTRIENAVLSYCRYLGKLLWPADLAVFYPFPREFELAIVTVGALLLLSISVAALKVRHKQPFVIMGWLWYLGMLVPVIGLVQAGEQSLADRYSYLPSIGILIGVVWGVYDLAKGKLLPKQVAAVCTCSALVICAMLTRQQISVWKNSESLFRHALRVTRNNHLAHNNLGTALEKQNRLEEGRVELEKAIKEKRNYAEAYDNLGVVLQKQGQLDQAIAVHSEALAIMPGLAVAHNHLGLALAAQDRFDEAIKHYTEAVKLRPDYADAHFNLALALAHRGRLDESIAEYRQTLQLQPRSADAHNNLGTVFDKKGDLQLAAKEYRLAITFKPDYARAHLNLGLALARMGKLQEAMAELQEALRLKPDFTEARQSLEALDAMSRSQGRN